MWCRCWGSVVDEKLYPPPPPPPLTTCHTILGGWGVGGISLSLSLFLYFHSNAFSILSLSFFLSSFSPFFYFSFAHLLTKVWGMAPSGEGVVDQGEGREWEFMSSWDRIGGPVRVPFSILYSLYPFLFLFFYSIYHSFTHTFLSLSYNGHDNNNKGGRGGVMGIRAKIRIWRGSGR